MTTPPPLGKQMLLWQAVLLFFVLPAVAQTPDSTATLVSDSTVVVLPDTGRAMPDTTRRVLGPPLGFPATSEGTRLGNKPLADVAEVGATDLLAGVPGSFLYDFGAVGWPDGWSPYGLDSQRLALTLDGRPFEDLVTGRPRYDLLPMALLEPLHLQPALLGAPLGVAATVRAFDEPRPLTELRYRASRDGWQSIAAMHQQQRTRALFGRPGVLSVLFGYSGQAADNEYPGSRLRRMRQLTGRLRYTQPGWSMEIRNLHTRRHLGAQGGVIPDGTLFETIYNRFSPNVQNPGAERQTIRNDLSATLWRTMFSEQPPLVASAYWTSQVGRYRNPGFDTLATRVHRFGGRLQQPLMVGNQHLRLTVEGWHDGLIASDALPDSIGLSRTRFFATVRDSVQLGGFLLDAHASLNAGDETFVSGAVQGAWQAGPLHLFAEGQHTAQPVAWTDVYGYGRFLQPLATAALPRVMFGRAGVTMAAGPFDITLFGFAHRTTQALDLYLADEEDVVEAQVSSTAVERVGAGVDVGWRRTAARGFYATAQPTVQQLQNPTASPEHNRLAGSLPDLWLNARVGARYLLFTGDLDLDVSLRARYWMGFLSRTLHAPTGLLVLPAADARPVEASGTLDLVVEGGVRTATLFLAYENMLSGTQLVVGNLLVPTYPLPAGRFLFGVYWPILN